MLGLYIHIPFCKQKCTYCDFASYPREINKVETKNKSKTKNGYFELQDHLDEQGYRKKRMGRS